MLKVVYSYTLEYIHIKIYVHIKYHRYNKLQLRYTYIDKCFVFIYHIFYDESLITTL